MSYLVITAGILAFPALLVQVVTIPLVALLSIPSLFFLLSCNSKTIKNDRYLSAEQKRIIVTGGSSGVGKGIACEAAKQGFIDIVIIARNEEKLEFVKKEIFTINPKTRVLALSADVSNAESMMQAAERIFGGKDELLKPTHVFCCAGAAYPEYFQNLSSNIFANAVQTNQLGSIYAAQAFIPKMTSGSITFCSSVCGQIGLFGYASYSPTKFALRGYAECLHAELCSSPIHVQVAYPPDVDTPGFQEENKTKPEETRIISEQGGLSQPQDIARVMLNEATKENPSFSVYFNFDGWMLSTLTAGMSPATTMLDAVSQVSCMSLFRWISTFYLHDWYRLIREYQSKSHVVKKKNE